MDKNAMNNWTNHQSPAGFRPSISRFVHCLTPRTFPEPGVDFTSQEGFGGSLPGASIKEDLYAQFFMQSRKFTERQRAALKELKPKLGMAQVEGGRRQFGFLFLGDVASDETRPSTE